MIQFLVYIAGDNNLSEYGLEDNFEMAMDYLAVIARWTLSLSQLLIQREGLGTLAEYGITPIVNEPDAHGAGA